MFSHYVQSGKCFFVAPWLKISHIENGSDFKPTN